MATNKLVWPLLLAAPSSTDFDLYYVRNVSLPETMHPGPPLRPVSLAKLGEDRLQITWNNGRVGSIAWSKLRELCPCASCKEERQRPPNPLRVLKESEIPRGPLRPTQVVPVGNYAYKIVWNDGHDTGIFTFDFLHLLCEWRPETDLSPKEVS